MKGTTEDPRAVEQPTDPQPGEAEFLTSNAGVPDAIVEDASAEFQQQQPAAAAPAQQTWTAEEVACYFAGVFMLMSFPLTRPLIGFGGEHWNIPDEKCQLLGQKWLPIFIKHIPYDRKPGMFADLIMWLPAMGAIKTVCGEPIKQEFLLRRQEKLRAMQARAGINPSTQPPAQVARPQIEGDDGTPPRSMTAPSTTANMATAAQ